MQKRALSLVFCQPGSSLIYTSLSLAVTPLTSKDLPQHKIGLDKWRIVYFGHTQGPSAGLISTASAKLHAGVSYLRACLFTQMGPDCPLNDTSFCLHLFQCSYFLFMVWGTLRARRYLYRILHAANLLQNGMSGEAVQQGVVTHWSTCQEGCSTPAPNKAARNTDLGWGYWGAHSQEFSSLEPLCMRKRRAVVERLIAPDLLLARV